MKPLLIANFRHVVGGGEIGLCMLAQGLTTRGHHPVIAVPGPGDYVAAFDRRIISEALVDACLEVREIAHQCDLIHCSAIRGMLTAILAGTGKPLVFHALIPNPDRLDPVVCHFADAVVCNSKATAKRFAEFANPRIVYNGVAEPNPTGEPLPLRQVRRTIGLMGATVPRKGQLDALPALQQVLEARSDVDVVFVGRVAGPIGGRLREVAESSGGRVRLLGFVPNVADYFGQFALIIVPSQSEGFGRVAVEALRAGVPVLATRIEGLIEALQDLDDPWLPDDKGQWGARILRELDSPSHSPDQLRAAAARFDPERYIDDILGLYECVCA